MFGMADWILIIVLVLIIGTAVAYIIKEKKRGVRCIGCPAAGTCAHAQSQELLQSSGCGGCCSSCSGCGCHADTK